MVSTLVKVACFTAVVIVTAVPLKLTILKHTVLGGLGHAFGVTNLNPCTISFCVRHTSSSRESIASVSMLLNGRNRLLSEFTSALTT